VSKREITDKAKLLLKENNIFEAVKLYNELQESFPEEINHWDVYFMLKCDNSDKGEESDKIKNLPELAERFIDEEVVKNLYVWYLYYKYTKRISLNNISDLENNANRIIEIGQQKDFANCTEEEKEFPCAYSLTVFKIIKAYKKPNFNISKVGYYLDKLEPEKLSQATGSMTDQKGRDRELASHYEDYYATLAKLRIKEGRHEECIAAADFGLQNIEKFHYDNDIWFKRNKALSLIQLDNEEEGFDLLLSLSKNRKGDKWFLFHEIAEIYFENQDYEHALEYCKKGIISFGEEAFKINLFILTARVLFKLERLDDAAIMAKFLVGLSLENDLKEKPDLSRITSYFKIDKSSIEDPRKYLTENRKEVDKIFGIDRNKNKKNKRPNKHHKPIQTNPEEEVNGCVSAIHKSGETGHVEVSGKGYFFRKSEAKVDKIKLEKGVNVMLILKDRKDKDGNPTKNGIITRILD